MKGVPVPAVVGDMAVLAPGVGDIEIVTDQRKAAGDLQRGRIRRVVEEQGVLLPRRPVIIEDANVLETGTTFTPIA